MSEEVKEIVEEPVETVRDMVEKAVEQAEADQQETVVEPAKAVETENDVKAEEVDQAEEKPVIDLKRLGYKKAEIEKLESLPDDVKAVLVDRDSRFHAGMKQYKEQAEIANVFTSALRPHEEYLQALQITPQDYIPSLVQTEKVLRLGSPQQKAEMIHRIAHDYGIDLQGVSQLQFDPNIYNLQQQIELRDRKLANEQQSRQIAEETQLVETIEQWAQDKEYFDEVRGDMALLLESGKAQDLDQAYDMAKRLNDSTFESVISQRLTQAQQGQSSVKHQRAIAAKQSSVQLKGSPSGNLGKPALNTTTDAVAYAMEQAGY